ncbi:MAG: glycogen synthase GlgA [Anaerorhabdus sp.]|uniref:glycogen synthase GlgA n=1 Tax=Anaerorhabdus sp. TaxID=1872524 RepID=UPI003A88E089
MKSILFAAAEGLPFIKSGGLADVIGSLPKILKQREYDVRVVLPLYKKIADKYFDQLEYLGTLQIKSGWIDQPASYFQTEVDGVVYYFVQHQAYFERDGLYGFPDDGERFSFYQKAILEMCKMIDFYPDILHAHDWHTGMLAALTKIHYSSDWHFDKVKHVYTIHNLAFQGNFPKDILGSCLGLSFKYYEDGSMRYDGDISFMKTGIVYSDKVTTVSPSYAKEILTPEYGEHLDEILRYRQHDLWGIVNGIDVTEWNPQTDKLLAKNYTAKNVAKGKKDNKLAVQKALGLREAPDVLMIGMVSRLTYQKGVYLIAERLADIMGLDIQFVVLGTGEEDAESTFRYMEEKYKRRAVYYCGYNEDLAHQIYAGCDLFLMPSLYEPCGIGQLIAMRYGSLPLVRETGGLRDTVHAFNQYTNEGNGFSFWSFSGDDLVHTLKFACDTYYMNPEGWKELVQHAMNTDVSWEYSANLYQELYEIL